MCCRLANTLLLSLFVAAIACANDEPQGEPQSEPQSEPLRKKNPPRSRSAKKRTEAPQLPLDAVRARLPESEFALIARASLGDRQAVIIWPAFNDGKLQSAEIVALAFQRQGLRWLPIGERVTLNQSDGRRELAALLGGPNFSLQRNCGRNLEGLIDGIQSDLKAFAQAHKRGDPAAALDAYTHYAASFAFDAIALDNRATEWLLAATNDTTFKLQLQADDDGDWLTADILRKGDNTRTRLPLIRCAGGWALGAPLP